MGTPGYLPSTGFCPASLAEEEEEINESSQLVILVRLVPCSCKDRRLQCRCMHVADATISPSPLREIHLPLLQDRGPEPTPLWTPTLCSV
jgi:hypothetical protein